MLGERGLYFYLLSLCAWLSVGSGVVLHLLGKYFRY